MKGATRLVLCLVLCVPITLVGSSVAQAPPPPKPPDPPQMKLLALVAAKPHQIDPKDDELRKLLQARYNEALGELKDFYKTKDVARASHADEWYGPWRRVVQAGLELYDKPADKVGLWTQYLEMTKEVEKLEQVRYEKGKTSIGQLHRTRYERLAAEIRLLRAKQDADKGKDK